MNKEFIPYEQALALKELGFDVPSVAWYDESGAIHGTMIENPVTKKDYATLLQAPLYQQAFRWFREKYNFVGTILGDGFNGELKGYYYSITEEGWINYYESIDDSKWYDTYEEAELACLRKLIEIIKNKENE